jgi:serine/threonine protein kinase
VSTAVPSLDHPGQIDRFIIKDILGKGAQGIVYLAEDPSLHRQVAIKAVSLRQGFLQQGALDNLMQEARTVSQLQHSNIVTIYDVGSFDSKPYLVLEYVQGESLHSMTKQALPIKRAVRIMRDVLAGVGAAHKAGIIHCDLKPANIMITGDGQAKVADFGLALLADSQQDDTDHLSGTPQYMAPEYIETRKHQTVSDVFSLGLVFYEMLTGKPAFHGEDVYQILNAIAHSPLAAPSSINAEIDEALDTVIMKSLEKDPQNRYQTAGEMLEALEKTLDLNEAMTHSDNADATIQFLLRRMNHKKDFPAFSRTISVLNRASASDTEDLSTVSNAILKDISLTNKVLRIVNSAYYSRGAGKINTISRAVIMLGINPIKSLAVSLMLFEHLQNKSQAHQLMDDAVASLFSALLAHDIARENNIKQHEEAFLCALLQQLGKLLVRFYLHEEAQAIDKQVEQNNVEEETAALKVLGTSYHRLGMAVAREWGFPEQIINSMKPLSPGELEHPGPKADKLHYIAQFSNAVCVALRKPDEDQDAAIKQLSKDFGKSLDINSKKIDGFIEGSKKELKQFSKLINFNISRSRFYQGLTAEAVEVEESARANAPGASAAQDSVSDLPILEQSMVVENHQDMEKALTDGIQDISSTLTGDFTINEVMQMVLETIYRAIPGSRVMLALRNKASNSIQGKFGYGEDVDELIRNFSVPLAYQPDVFHLVFKNNVDIKIDNSQDEKIRNKIPDWYHRKIGAKFFVLFPIVIKHSPIAVIYIDSHKNGRINITDAQLSLLKTLRNQAVLAIKSAG